MYLVQQQQQQHQQQHQNYYERIVNNSQTKNKSLNKFYKFYIVKQKLLCKQGLLGFGFPATFGFRSN